MTLQHFVTGIRVFPTEHLLVNKKKKAAVFGDWIALVDVDLSFSELVNDLLRCVGSPDHLSPLFA